jgi:hypothetical protein
MESAITALKDTPIPTILVVAGIVFLLLAIAGQLAGRIAVAPERQRWAAIIGGGLLAIGIALHVVPQVRMIPPAPLTPSAPSKPNQLAELPQTPATKPPTPPSDDKPDNSPVQKRESSRQEVQTRYSGVVANIARFEKTGELVTLELIVRNHSDETIRVCTHSNIADLIDQTTGQKWDALHSGGHLDTCGSLGANQSSGAWMQFKIPNPEKRTFSLSSHLFNTPIDNLVLGEHP